MLSTVDLDDAQDQVQTHADVHARLFGASEVERDAAVEVVVAALRHSLLRRASAAHRKGLCRRETGLVIRVQDGTLLEGIVDLAQEGDEWRVVDLKTDAELASREQTYRRQVARYVRRIPEATSMRGHGYTLLV